ncbi:MAG: hypothetical protein QOE41_1595 [Mycobacterium sp.]|nr:hypothetical protein [Mycobacterium sp.]MDT5132284.1 hypothetical protein [Mycobacterium sp.]
MTAWTVLGRSDHPLTRRGLDQTAGPAGKPVLPAGLAQANDDSVHAIVHRLPIVLVVIAAITFVLLFC